MTALAEAKRALRAAALARRHGQAHPDPSRLLRGVLSAHPEAPLSAYVAMRGEIDPLPALLAHRGPVGLPVVRGRGLALAFRRWRPGGPLVPSGFGTLVPEADERMTPCVLVVPLVAFDRRMGRLGYGGGFYDRTLAALRAAGPALAIGFAWAAQEVDAVPREATDAPLDMVVTESEVIAPGPLDAPRPGG